MLMSKPREEILFDARWLARLCLEGHREQAGLLPIYVEEGGFSWEDLGVTREDVFSWIVDQLDYS
jgi:hypothetical protein